MLADVRAAVSFLTRIPAHDAKRPFELSRTALWFPLVGVLVGALMAGVRALAGLGLDPAPATLLALLAAVLITGGFHEDGLADAADGMGAHVSRERRLEIFKDSRVGTYGALAVAFMVAFPLLTLTPLDGGDFLAAALAGHVLGRWSTLPQAWLLPPAAPGGSGSQVRTSAPVVLLGSAYSAAIVLAVCGLGAGALALLVAALVTFLGGLYFKLRLGGVSGDTFGAVNKVVELSVYAALGASLT